MEIRVIYGDDGARDIQFRSGPGQCWKTAPVMHFWDAFIADLAEGVRSLDEFPHMSAAEKAHFAAQAKALRTP